MRVADAVMAPAVLMKVIANVRTLLAMRRGIQIARIGRIAVRLLGMWVEDNTEYSLAL